VSETRLEIVEPCEHGEFGFHRVGEWYQCEGGPRRVLSIPTDQMVEAAAAAIWVKLPRYELFYPECERTARTVLTTAFNTLGIQETVK
jgi:hypothetical protein